LLLITSPDTTPVQEALARHVHGALAQGAVVCNSFVSPASDQRRAQKRKQDSGPSPFLLQKWAKLQSKCKDVFTAEWMQQSLQQHGTVYLTDIILNNEESSQKRWREEAEAMVCQLVGQQTMAGFLLRHCSYPTPGVHTPSFFALFSSKGQQGVAITSPHHNESHRTAAWHLLLRHPSPLESQSSSSTSTSASDCMVNDPAPMLLSSPANAPSSLSISLIHKAMAAKSKVYAGTDHLLDNIDTTTTIVKERRTRKTTRTLEGLSARDLYASSVSLTFGELTEDSSWSVLEALGMTPFSRLLDVGSAYGRFCIHAALASPGVSVTGIEVGITRAQLAARFLDELMADFPAVMASVRHRIKLVQGDILCNLHELFVHSHVFLFDARFTASMSHILAHLLSYLSGVSAQVVISCQPLDKINADLVRGEPLSLVLSGGRQAFTAHSFTINERLKNRHMVEVFESPVHGLGVRAVRAIRAGQTIMRVKGELIFDTYFVQQSDVTKSSMYPYLSRMNTLDRPGKRAFLHALDVSRYINSHINTNLMQNVAFNAVEDELYVIATCDIGKNEELLHHYENWTTDHRRPWTTDWDLV
jgi:hypothetical protein